MSEKHLRLAVDIGGTFVDAIELDTTTGAFRFQKASTTPRNPSEGVLNAIAALETPLDRTALFTHGTTLGLNAVLERRGAKVGIVTNEGFRDIFLIGRANVPDAHMYDFTYARPEPLVRRRCIAGVKGRLDYKGRVVDELDEDGVVAAARHLIDEHRVEAIAICFLFSFIDPASERRAKTLILEAFPEMRVSISSDIAREHREYERTSTTVLDAYIRPIFERYIDELEARMRAQAFDGRFLIMRSGGGAMTAEAAKRSPTNTVLSGPAGGIAGGAFLGQALERHDLITFDVGGTSLDVCLIEDGRAAAAFEASLENHPLLIPIYDIRTIGAGGGSIAWLDAGLLNVGPQSAGAEPGPICYGRGGTQPTVTDACLVLGYIDPDAFLGGTMRLDDAAAGQGLAASIAQPMAVTPEAAAAGILDILMAKTVGAVRQITVERGRDPRESALLAFGGAGPLFGPMCGHEMDLKEVIVPNAPSGFSAWGMLSADVVDDFSRTHIALIDEVSPEALGAIFAEIEREAVESLRQQGVRDGQAMLLRQLELRYLGQEHALPLDLGVAIAIDAIVKSFGDQHEARYGHRMEAPVQILNIRIRAVGNTAKPTLPELPARPAGKAGPKSGVRRAYCFTTRQMTDFATYTRADLAPGDTIAGPALIDEGTSVTVMHTGQTLSVDRYGHLIVAMAG
ncbi:MAG: hydantoinase/oxoprolinase family protein [Alphaproteobacteria bacterium]